MTLIWVISEHHRGDDRCDRAQRPRGRRPGTTVVGITPHSGPPSIESHYDEAMSVPGLLATITRGEDEGVDGYVIACFGDPGLEAARRSPTGP